MGRVIHASGEVLRLVAIFACLLPLLSMISPAGANVENVPVWNQPSEVESPDVLNGPAAESPHEDSGVPDGTDAEPQPEASDVVNGPSTETPSEEAQPVEPEEVKDADVPPVRPAPVTVRPVQVLTDEEIAGRLKGLETWQILQDDTLLKELYDVGEVKKVVLGKVPVTITVLDARSDSLLSIEQAPMMVARISSNGYEVRHPLYPSRRARFEYSAPKSSPPLLAITERCWCEQKGGDLVHLFMVYKKAIRPLGAVSGLKDMDGDGKADPFVYDTTFSDGIGLMDPSKAPLPVMLFAVSDGRLVYDKARQEQYYKNQIERLNGIIKTDRKETPGSGDLTPVLEKFLYYRAMGKENEGWKALESDILLYDDMFFPQKKSGGRGVENIPVEEIISRVREALGKKWGK